MMDHKKTVMREARARIMIMVSDIGEEKKLELYEKYKSDVPTTISETNHIILVGNWMTNAAKMLLRGATEEELKAVVEHLIVLIGARKYNLDFKRSHKDHNLITLTRKYFHDDKFVEIKVSENRTEMVKRREAYRQAVTEKVQALRTEGLSNAQIAEKLKLPESTIRTIT